MRIGWGGEGGEGGRETQGQTESFKPFINAEKSVMQAF